jgi:hypothetical protein
MKAADRDIRMQIMLDNRELQAIDQWRFDKRMPSRSAAMRELLRRGLASEGFAFAEAGKHSSSFGVMDDVNGPRTRKGA